MSLEEGGDKELQGEILLLTIGEFLCEIQAQRIERRLLL